MRWQLALSLGAAGDAATPVLGRLLVRDGGDPWALAAALSSSKGRSAALVAALARDPAVPVAAIGKLATLVGAEGDADGLRQTLASLADAKAPAAILDGLGQGMRNGPRGLHELWVKPPPEMAEAVQAIRRAFQAAAAKTDPSSLRLLGFAPPDIALEPLAATLDPKHPPDVQSAAVKALAAQPGSRPAEILLERWDTFGPAVRREVVEALRPRPDRTAALLAAVEASASPPARSRASAANNSRRPATQNCARGR